MNINFYLVINGYAVIEDYSNEFDPNTWKLYVHDPIKISVKTDKISYFQGDIVNITGGVVSDDGPVSGVYINIEVDKPNGSPIFVDQVKTDNNGNFSTNFRLSLDAPLGKYNVTAIYGGISGYVQFEVISQIIYTLADFPKPFVEDGLTKFIMVIGTSDLRGPAYPAHTIDVAAATMIANSLGKFATSNITKSYMDWEVVAFNNTHTLYLYRPGNIITTGGRGVNLVTMHYNDKLCVRMGKDEQGDYIYSTKTGNKYRMINEYFQGKDVTDYAMIVLYKDIDRYVLISAGLSGFSTRAASEWLSQMPQMSGMGIILKLYDPDGDGKNHIITIEEIV
jgi:hypothetical protein